MAWSIVFVGILVTAALSIIVTTLRIGISPQPSTRKARKALLELAPKEMRGNIAELGSGWGGLAFALAKHYPEASVSAYELSYVPYLFSTLRLKLQGQNNLQFLREDFLTADLSQTALIVTYLFPGGMGKIAAQLIPRLRKNTILLTNTFALPGHHSEQKIILKDFYHTPVYRYRVD
jgi:hypothetical protein